MKASKRIIADWVADGADGLLYEDLTYKIRGACFRVQNELGSRLNELAYQRALAIEFEKVGLKFERERSFPIRYDGKTIGKFVVDFVVEDSVLLELKAKPVIGPAERDQFWRYLRQSDYKLGLLVNFGAARLHIERRIFDAARDDRRSSAEESA